MKRYKTIDELHNYIERQAKRIIKHYYTDYKNIDRPALMKATGNKETIYIIFRSCGSYLYTAEELKTYDFGRYVMDYYTADPTAVYFKIDLKNLTAERITAGLPKECRQDQLEKIA